MIEEIIKGLPAVLICILLTLGITGYIGAVVWLCCNCSKSKRMIGYIMAISGIIIGILLLSWVIGGD